MSQSNEEIQAAYYRATASQYDAMHVQEDDEHGYALRFISGLVPEIGIESVLDVGCGTGRALRHFRQHHPAMKLHGIEPVAELVDVAIAKHGVPAESIRVGRGEQLPFADQSVDAVCEFGILHHVERPADVVAEMLRVARKAVFISDSNRFGQGRVPTRWLKLGLYKAGLWKAVNLVHTRGRGYHMSEGDGLSYSYSVYDNYKQIAQWASRVVVVPTMQHTTTTWLSPLLTSGHVLLCAFR